MFNLLVLYISKVYFFLFILIGHFSPSLHATLARYGQASNEFTTDGCGSSDSVCANIYYQSSCGNLKRWATESSLKWAVVFRREVYWDSECEVSMIDIKAVESPIDRVHAALKANLILSVIANFIGGMYIPFAIIQVKVMGSSALFCQTCFKCKS